MAYKFQIGKAKLSGSVELAEQLKVQSGGLQITGSVLLPNDSIQNEELQNSTISGKELGTSLDTLSAAANGGLSAFSYDGSGAVTVALTSSIAGAGLAWSSGVLSVDTAEIAAGLSGSVEAMIGAFVEGSDFVTFDDSTGTIGVSGAAFTGSARSVVSVTDAGGDGSLSYNASTGVITYTGPSAAEARAHVSAVDAGGDGSFSYDSSTGAFTYTGPSAAEARAHFSALTGAAYQNGNISYNSATGQVTLQPVEESWVRQRLGAVDAVKYNNASGQISLQLSGTSLSQNADGLKADLKTKIGSYDNSGSLSYNVADGQFTFRPVDPAWVKGHFSAGAGLDYADGVFSVGTAEVTNAMLAGAIENSKLVNSSVTINGTAGEVTVVGGGSLALGGTATVSLPSTISKNLTFSGQVTMENLIVTGSLTTVNSTNLEIKDARILMASGSTGWATDVGFDFGSHVGHATLLTAEVNIDGSGGAENVLSSSLPLVAPSMKADTFYGNFVGASILGIVTEGGSTATISANVTRANNAAQVLTLPSAPAVGQEHRIKCVVADASSPVITIQPASGAKLEGVVDAQITLESFGAAVSLVWGGSSEGWMVF
jgi:hypothetical protein